MTEFEHDDLLTLSGLIDRVQEYRPNESCERLIEAHDFAAKSHAGQLKKTGVPYFQKVMTYAFDLAAIQAPEVVVSTCLLSDTIEDTVVTFQEVSDKFGRFSAEVIVEFDRLRQTFWRRDRLVRDRSPDDPSIYRRQRLRNFLGACFHVDGTVHRSFNASAFDDISPIHFIDEETNKIKSISEAGQRERNAISNMIGFVSQNVDLLHQVSPREFEILIAGLLHGRGYEVELTQSSRDGGIDVFAMKYDGVFVSRFAIECKRYSPDNPVGVKTCRELFGVVESQRLTGGIIATSSKFTKPAIAFSEQLCDRLSLIDALGVRRLLAARSGLLV